MRRGEDDRSDEIDGTELVYSKRFDVTKNRSISLAIIEAIDTVLDDTDAATYSLFDVIDPDAIDNLFRPRRNGLPRVNGSIRFPLGEFEVDVSADGLVEISRREPTDDEFDVGSDPN